MHARVITAQLAHDRLDEAGRHYRQTLLPNLGHQPGFRGALLLVEADTGKSLTILLWETEADLRASERDSAYPQQLAASFAGTPTREVYQVSAELISRVTD
jgi:hypothetical protein